jgi:hypothetical protein
VNTQVAPQRPETDVAADYHAAIQAFQSGSVDEARMLLQRCLTHDPRHIGVRVGLASCEARAGNVVRAEQVLREVLDEHPRLAHVHAELGALLVTQGRTAEGRRELAHALEIDPAQRLARAKLAELDAAPRIAPRPPPVPQAASNGHTPRKSLASELDDADAEPSPRTAGRVIVEDRRRRLWSHRRLWLGLALLLSLALAELAQRRFVGPATAVPTLTPAPGITGLPFPVRAPDLGQALFGVFTALLEISGALLLGIALLLVVSALLNRQTTSYTVRERRIEITQGVLFRTRKYIWLHDITDIQLAQDPALMLAGTAQIKVQVDGAKFGSITPRRTPAIIGIGSLETMLRLFDQLQARIVHERRAMKRAFI